MRTKSSNFSLGTAAWVAALAAVVVTGLQTVRARASEVPIPQVQGPLAHPVTQGIGVWRVSKLGYVAKEYLVSGRDNVYAPVSMADALSMSSRNNVRDLAVHSSYTPTLIRRNVRYTTRIVVYLPKNPAKFSGNVVVEITHPAGGGQLIVWSVLSGFFTSHGDAYVAIQHPITFGSLRVADPARYGSLYASSPTQLWGMVTQIGALIRSQNAENPLRGYRVRHLYLTGYSYTGVATSSYADYYHDQARLKSGKPIFSGYLPFANSMYVKPLDVPVIRVNTQSDFNSFDGTRNRRHDSNGGRLGRYRLYEVAGASHVNASPKVQPSASPPREVKLPQPPGLPNFPVKKCLDSFPRGARKNNVPLNYVLEQAFVDMYRWVDHGVPPPRVPFIKTDAKGNTLIGRNGNAEGGLRLPELAVPADTYGVGTGMCFLFGYRVPFSRAKMKALYGTPQLYVKAIEAAAHNDVKAGLISSAAAAAIVRKARHKRF
jgi:hypothetical protein